MTEVIPSLRVSPGQAHPLGASELENGVNFAIFSQHATSVTLCLQLPQRLGPILLLNSKAPMFHSFILAFVNRTYSLVWLQICLFISKDSRQFCILMLRGRLIVVVSCWRKGF